MGALIQTKARQFASFTAIVSPPRPRLVPAAVVSAHETRAFHGASTPRGLAGGGGGIRTHEGLSSLPVFKTGALNRSANPPLRGIAKDKLARYC